MRRKRAVFRDPKGGVHMDVGWSAAELAPVPAPDSARDPVEALVRANRRRGIDPDAWTAGARWKREWDVPDEVLFRALDATL